MFGADRFSVHNLWTLKWYTPLHFLEVGDNWNSLKDSRKLCRTRTSVNLLRNCSIYTQILFSHWLNAALGVMEVVNSLTLLTCDLCRQRDCGHQREPLDSGKSALGTTLVTCKGIWVGYRQHLLQSTHFPTQTHHVSSSSVHSILSLILLGGG